MLNVIEEVRKLRTFGITLEQIKEELKQRDLPEIEVRYFKGTDRNPSEDESILAKYSREQLTEIADVYTAQSNGEEVKEMRMVDKVLDDLFKENEKVIRIPKQPMPNADIYEEIKQRLASCNHPADYEDAYKWLARQFVLANESAKKFEDKVIEKYGEEEFGVLLYGSKEAYEREKSFEDRIKNASSAQEVQTVMIEKIALADMDEENIPELWPEDEMEEELPLAQ